MEEQIKRDYETTLIENTIPLDELEDEEIDNGLIVGSVGRTTAVRNVSDFDLYFSLPSEVYRRFDSYEGNW